MVCRASPHATTFGRGLAAVDVAVLQRTLTGWVLDRCQARRRSALADMQPRRGNYSAGRWDPDVSTGQFGEDVEGSSAVLGGR
jgi:hypothetical protein